MQLAILFRANFLTPKKSKTEKSACFYCRFEKRFSKNGKSWQMFQNHRIGEKNAAIAEKVFLLGFIKNSQCGSLGLG